MDEAVNEEVDFEEVDDELEETEEESDQEEELDSDEEEPSEEAAEEEDSETGEKQKGDQKPKDEESSKKGEKAEAGSAGRKYTVKVNEEDVEVSEEELIRGYGRMRAANEKFEKAAAIEKNTAKLIETLKSDPAKILEHLGFDMRTYAEKVLAQQLEEELLPEEERERRRREADLQTREEKLKQQEEEKRQAEAAALQQKYASEYENTIVTALKESGLPKTPQSVKRMAELMYANLEKGVDLDAKDLVQIVREDYLGDIKTLLGELEGDSLLELLGEDVAKKLRKADLARLNQKPEESTEKNDDTPRKRRKPKKQTVSDFFDELNEQVGLG